MAAFTEPRRHNLGDLFSLAGQVAVIADSGGCGGGEIAMLLAQAGAKVVLFDRDLTVGEAAVARNRAAGLSIEYVTVDIEDEASVVAGMGDVSRRFGRFDILVNAAGMIANQPFAETSAAIWDEVYSLNIRAPFLCSREAVKAMIAAGNGGRIASVSTMGALIPVLQGNAAYGSARAALTMLTRDIARDCAEQGIRANVIFVGAVSGKVRTHESTLRRPGNAVSRGVMPERQLLGRGEMIDVAAAVLYTVSHASAYMTGQSITLDGGYMLS